MKNGLKILQKRVEELEKLEIVKNNPIRKDNNELYKLKIINPDISIETQDIAYSLENKKN